MSSWIVITAAHLDDVLLSAGMTSFRSAALGSGQLDTFTELMRSRSDYVRNRIAGRVRLSATAYSVPPELKHQACLLIIEAIAGRLFSIVSSLQLTEEFRSQITRAYKDLDIAGTVDFPISTPRDAIDADVQAGGGVELVTQPTRKATRTSMEGL
jgi:hypothetical protein